MNRKEKEELLTKVIDNKVRKLKSAAICYICPNKDKDIDIIDIGEEVVNISGTRNRVAHARHFRLIQIVVGVK